MNEKLGNVGQTVVYCDPVEARPVEQRRRYEDLAEDMQPVTSYASDSIGGNPCLYHAGRLEFSTKYLAQCSAARPP